MNSTTRANRSLFRSQRGPCLAWRYPEQVGGIGQKPVCLGHRRGNNPWEQTDYAGCKEEARLIPGGVLQTHRPALAPDCDTLKVGSLPQCGGEPGDSAVIQLA